MNNNFKKRLLAYVIDAIVLSIIMLLVSFGFSLFGNDNVNKLNKQLSELNTEYLENDELNYGEYINQYAEINYLMSKEEIPLNIVNALFIIVLFILVTHFKDGSTIGKSVMRIKIIEENGNKPSINTLLIRSLFINSLGYLLLSLLFVFVLNSFAYFILTFILTIFEFSLVIISGFMILYRHDECGVHDKIAHTRVVDL